MPKPIYPDPEDVERKSLLLRIAFDKNNEPVVQAMALVPPTNREEPVLSAETTITLTAGEANALKNFADGLLANINQVLDF